MAYDMAYELVYMTCRESLHMMRLLQLGRIMDGVPRGRPGAQLFTETDYHIQDQDGVFDRLDGITQAQKIGYKRLDGGLVRKRAVAECGENETVAELCVSGIRRRPDVLPLLVFPEECDFFENRCHFVVFLNVLIFANVEIIG